MVGMLGILGMVGMLGMLGMLGMVGMVDCTGGVVRIQGCINRSILPSGMGARGVSSEHVENMEMFSGSPLRRSLVLQLRCALVIGEPCSGSWRTVLRFSENRAQADPLMNRALDKYFKDHNQRGGGKWRMYHSDETRFYQTVYSKVTRRLLKSKFTFVDV